MSTSFHDLGLNPALLRGIEDLNFTEPTPIQYSAIPPALEGRDLLACSMTGSGKTAAFLLPILTRLMDKRTRGTRALVLTPTRELAAQIDEHLRILARHTPITSAAVFGGVAAGPQERAFRNGADVLIATPGRLLDHMRQPYARLDGLEHLVLDEADRMLDMGFLPDIRRILKALPVRRQTYFFSATMPPPIAALAREMLKDPVALNAERQVAPPTGITHAVYNVPQTMKSPLLAHLLERNEMESVVVFTRTKHRANRLAAYLEGRGVSCARIHGNRSQSQRTLALAGFKNREFRVLVATDIAARGIDVEALSHVVNFDVPNVAEDYIHRVGRTARAEATGDAVTFVSPEETGDLQAIEKALGKKIQRLSAPEFDVKSVQGQQPETPVGERMKAMREAKAARPAKVARPAQPKPSMPSRTRAKGSQPAESRPTERTFSGTIGEALRHSEKRTEAAKVSPLRVPSPSSEKGSAKSARAGAPERRGGNAAPMTANAEWLDRSGTGAKRRRQRPVEGAAR